MFLRATWIHGRQLRMGKLGKVETMKIPPGLSQRKHSTILHADPSAWGGKSGCIPQKPQCWPTRTGAVVRPLDKQAAPSTNIERGKRFRQKLLYKNLSDIWQCSASLLEKMQSHKCAQTHVDVTGPGATSASCWDHKFKSIIFWSIATSLKQRRCGRQ